MDEAYLRDRRKFLYHLQTREKKKRRLVDTGTERFIGIIEKAFGGEVTVENKFRRVIKNGKWYLEFIKKGDLEKVSGETKREGVSSTFLAGTMQGKREYELTWDQWVGKGGPDKKSER